MTRERCCYSLFPLFIDSLSIKGKNHTFFFFFISVVSDTIKPTNLLGGVLYSLGPTNWTPRYWPFKYLNHESGILHVISLSANCHYREYAFFFSLLSYTLVRSIDSTWTRKFLNFFIIIIFSLTVPLLARHRSSSSPNFLLFFLPGRLVDLKTRKGRTWACEKSCLKRIKYVTCHTLFSNQER